MTGTVSCTECANCGRLYPYQEHADGCPAGTGTLAEKSLWQQGYTYGQRYRDMSNKVSRKRSKPFVYGYMRGRLDRHDRVAGRRQAEMDAISDDGYMPRWQLAKNSAGFQAGYNAMVDEIEEQVDVAAQARIFDE